ncbi:ribosome recycling factor [Abyssibacter profundi]|uniref:Ribosome-recycling factor n=1 Tax=Abyssibacter profundi TaxID=2182787 RepID=A0A383XQ26_9GAMM|nr:ribosome recycling factor [Abyssibacter profundi]MBV62881.1 ribosome recycling factor [Nevskiales bacterium]PWN54730.1 ribosome recycling factor [Abyssibacter profundi]
MIQDILKDAAQRMSKSIDVLQQEFTKIRTGRAHPSLLDHVTVDYYGSEVPLSQAANITSEDARTLTIQPWEKTMVAPIEKALMKSDLGLNPNTAGTVIRIVLPPLTEERRRDLVKVVRAEAESARVAIRNVRRDANSDLKELQKEGEISEDDLRRSEQDIQKITDEHVAKVDAKLAAKEEEMMAV